MPATPLGPDLTDLIGLIARRPELAGGFYLAGGTALAIHLGHRRSIDLDFFRADPFDAEVLIRCLADLGGDLRVREAGTIHAVVRGIKVSLFQYPYRLIAPMTTHLGLNLASVADIAAMKIVAIAQRGSKKDFFDVFEILKVNSPKEMKMWFLEKFGDRQVNCYHILRSLFFFDDAEHDPEPISLNGTNWETVKWFFRAREREFFATLLGNDPEEDLK